MLGAMQNLLVSDDHGAGIAQCFAASGIACITRVGPAGNDQADTMPAKKSMSGRPKIDAHLAHSAGEWKIRPQSLIAIADIGGTRAWRYIAQAQIEICMFGT